MDFRRIRFLKSAASAEGFPPDDVPEVAFAGRSNAGKSSALNALTRHGALARVSKTPGRTQLINFFELESGGRLVDLPGYGYAKVPTATREQWRELIESYIEQRAGLCGVVVLMDARHPFTDADRQLIDWLGALERPTHLLLTKADKLSRNQAEQALRKARRELHAALSMQLFSATAGTGLEQLTRQLGAWITGEPEQAEAST